MDALPFEVKTHELEFSQRRAAGWWGGLEEHALFIFTCGAKTAELELRVLRSQQSKLESF